MPVNAPAEYFAAEERFKSAKTRAERILALEEMIRLLPRHHGSEQMLSQLKSRLAKLKKETESKKGARKTGLAKEGEAQVCILGLTQSGKSTLLAALTGAKPLISSHPYTTTRPEVGMLDYRGIKVQVVEIPSTFSAEHLAVARTADGIVLVTRSERDAHALHQLLSDNYIKIKAIVVSHDVPAEKAKERIWAMLGLMVVYARKTKTPMALCRGATVRDFTARIHKDFLKGFRYARIFRSSRVIKAGLNYELADGDVVEIHAK